jgi:hypothetical protein
LEAIAKERFLAPTAATPYRLQWLAALSIAARDPWPEADAWLAGLLARGDRLVEDGRPDPPELAATAAGVLLRRHQCAPATFGLQQAADPLLTRIGVDGFRFPTAATRAKVRQWWDAQANARP